MLAAMPGRRTRRDRGRRPVPRFAHWLFWEHDIASLDVARHANTIIARIVEHGTLREVRWMLEGIGASRVRRFFREVPHPDVSERTRRFWRAYFRASERWPEPPRWREHSSAPWVG
jgi:hypothetical protein